MPEQQQAVDATETMPMPMIPLKITCPGGKKLTLEVSPYFTNIYQIKSLVEKECGTQAEYLRLICRGKKIEDEGETLFDLGIYKPSTIMAVHNEVYAADQTQLAAIEKVVQEAEEVKKISDLTVVRERVTQLCCQIDGIDTRGSMPLRSFRRRALARVQAIEVEKRAKVEEATTMNEADSSNE